MTEKLCDCMPDNPPYRIEHYESEHRDDCMRNLDGDRCGGCMECLSLQMWYYEERDKGNE